MKKIMKTFENTRLMINYVSKLDWKGNELYICKLYNEYLVYYYEDIPEKAKIIIRFSPNNKPNLIKIMLKSIIFNLKK